MKFRSYSVSTLLCLVTVGFTVLVAINQHQLRLKVCKLSENAEIAFENRRLCERLLDLYGSADLEHPDRVQELLQRFPYEHCPKHKIGLCSTEPQLVKLDEKTGLELLILDDGGSYILLALFRRENRSDSAMIDKLELITSDIDEHNEIRLYDIDDNGILDLEITTTCICDVRVWKRKIAITAEGFEIAG